MAAAEIHIEDETEQTRIERWRAEELERAGYGTLMAAQLAASPEVDLHKAVDLLRRGCAPELAVRILRCE